MDTEKKFKIREVVRDIMENKVNSLVNSDIFSDNEVRDRVLDDLYMFHPDFVNDEEVEDCLYNGDDGRVDTQIYEQFVETLTDCFMNRFENK